MTIITARIPEKLDQALSSLAREIDRPKGYIMRKALENYIEEKLDLLIAIARIEKGDETISLSEIKEKYDLED
jgi:RHH-type transcriptional regulator, rel operon repressor / antitoxin RelB